MEDINTYQPFSNGTGSVEHARHYEQYFIWALWILVNMMITMFLTILLAVSSPNRATPEVPSTTVPGSHASASSATPIIEALYHLAARSVWSVKLSLREQLLFVLNCFVIVLWALFIYGEPYTPLREHGTEIYAVICLYNCDILSGLGEVDTSPIKDAISVS